MKPMNFLKISKRLGINTMSSARIGENVGRLPWNLTSNRRYMMNLTMEQQFHERQQCR